MRSRTMPLTSAPLLAMCLYSSAVVADLQVLDLFVGSWDIDAETLQPTPGAAHYSERYDWVLDGKFLRGETGRKADGSQDIVFGTYDAQADGYTFWIFSSSGSFIYLPPGTWDERRRIMEWRNPKGFDLNYYSSCRFPDSDNRYCDLIMKDWKGQVILELKWHAARRAD
ncbi:MAG: DUF1579 family protein [Gammaproteobacteria bacterium]|nr:DUF1579 family protein [Gammaproteobacteria bacterium]